MADTHPKAIHDVPYRTMGRRRFVETLLGAGFSAVAATSITAEDVEAAGRDQVPIAVNLEGDQTKLVPADWYADYRRAARINRNIDLMAAHEAIVGQGLVPGEYGGHNAYIEVNVDANADRKAEARGTVPETVDGVPVEVTEIGELELLGGCHGGEDFGDTIPGGVQVEGDSLQGSMGPRLKSTNDSSFEGFGTAQHLYSSCGSNTEGKDLYHPGDSSQAIGTVVEAFNFGDFVATDTSNGHSPEARIVKGSSSTDFYDVVGSFTMDALSDMKANNEDVRKVGVASCETKGEVKAVDVSQADENDCTLEKQGQVRWGTDQDATSGDSGSVAFAQSTDPDVSDYNVASLVLGHSPTDLGSFIYGTGVFHIRENVGYYYA